MDWREHARRSLYVSRMGGCTPHELQPLPVVETEVMCRFDCRCCNGSAWVAWMPSAAQGADPDEFVAFVEVIVNECSQASAKAS